MPYRDSEKQRTAQREWAERNRSTTRRHKKRVRTKKRELMRRLLIFRGCQLCGYRRCAEALTFHHLDPSTKEGNVGEMVGANLGFARIKTEMRKCVILCHNCHAEVHAGIRKVPGNGPQLGSNPRGS